MKVATRVHAESVLAATMAALASTIPSAADAVSSEVEETKEVELIKQLWRIAEKKKSERSPTDIALLVDKIIAVLEPVADAFDRRRKLQLLSLALSGRQLQRAILDHRVLSLLKPWLEPLPNERSDDINVRLAILDILLQSPIDLREQMKSSGIEEVVLLLSKSKEDVALTRTLAGALVHKWHVEASGGVLGDYEGPDVKKLKTCEEEEAHDYDLLFRMISYTKMVEDKLKRMAECGKTSEELMKLGITVDEFYDDGDRTITKDEEKLYFEAVRESGGFDVPDFPGVYLVGYIQPIHKLDAYIEQLTTCINVAIQEKCPDLKLVKILKANDEDLRRYFITFEAEEPDGQMKTYQTKVFVGLPGDKIEVEQFRQKPSIRVGVIQIEKEKENALD